ncbi:MAG: hypothetical protein ACFB16_21275 [Phormidesmis sp.]
MISRSLSQPVGRPTRLLLGTLMGLMALGGTAQKAQANPIQAIPIVGDLLSSTRPAPLPSELDFFHDNVQGNNVNLCVLTCGPVPTARPPAPQGVPQRIPQGVPQRIPQGVPRSAPQGIPQGVRLPQGAPAANAPRPNGSSPNVTVNVPPINIPL